MDFSFIINSIPKLREIILPGLEAQIKMASMNRNLMIQIRKTSNLYANRASVLICIYKNNFGRACFALIKRADDNSVHSGQISLPGGRSEKFDNSGWFTATRETEEEIGLNKNELNFIKELSSIYIPPSNFIVFPYLGIYDKIPSFQIDKKEVKKVFSVSLETLLDKKSTVKIDINNSYMNERGIPAFNFDGNIVWGATAMILSEFKFLLKEL